MATKPIVLLCSRTLSMEELKALNKFFTTMEFVPAFHTDRQIARCPYEVVHLDIRDRQAREAWAINSKDFDLSTDTVVWVRKAGDEQEQSSLDNFGYRFTLKHIRTDAPDKATMLNSLRGLHVGGVVSRKKKFFQALLSFLGCLFKR